MITKLQVKNFKSIVEGDFSLSNLNLLTGVNSAGKSSVIQALRIIELAGFPDSREHSITKKSILELPGHGDYSQLRSQIGTSENTQDISFVISEEKRGSLLYTIGNRHCEIKFDGFHGDNSNNIDRYNLFQELHYISADRLGPQVFHPESTEDHSVIGEHGQNSYRFLSEHSSDTIYAPVVGKSLSLRLAVERWMSEIAPGSEILAENQKQYDIASLTVNGYRPTNVGFGVSYTLPVIIALLVYSSKPGTILCIENPEAHLHPRAQTSMGELIARCAASGTQLIVETHSDHLLDGIRIAIKKKFLKADQSRIYFFDRIGGKTNIDSLSIDQNGNIKERWPKGFFDQFMINGKALLK